MLQLNPERAYEALKDRVAEAIKDYFPQEGKLRTIHATRIYVEDNLAANDVTTMSKAKMARRTMSVPVYGDFKLVDKKTGKVLDTANRLKVAALPKITRHFSYIVDGNEYQFSHQLRLKRGAYTRQKDNGEMEVDFNLEGGRRNRIKVNFIPETRKYILEYGTANIPLYPILKAMNVDDYTIEKAWGREIFSANQVPLEKGLQAFYKSSKRFNDPEPKNIEDLKEHVRRVFEPTQMDKNVNKQTLGEPIGTLNGEALLRGSTKLLKVYRNEEEEDDRDSLIFKELHGPEDFIGERIRNSMKEITRRISNNIDRKTDIKEIITPDIFNMPIKTAYTKLSLANTAEQVNPLEMLSGHTSTTIMGEGGIQSEHAITTDPRMVNPSTMSFLDPVHTPEGNKIGVTLHMALGANKVGKQITSTVYEVKTGKFIQVDPKQMYESVVAFPDAVKWEGRPGKGGKPIPLNPKEVTVSIKGNPDKRPWSQVKYVVPDPKLLFDTATNLIPFMQNNQGNRSLTASKQQEQGVPLVYREAPKVQVDFDGEQSMEDVVGKFTAISSPVSGSVVKVDKDNISIKDVATGKTIKVPIYNNYPLNEKKSVMHSVPIVKPGDKVRKGQVIADSSFTKGGTLALGTNLRVGYVAHKGYNYEDGVVISESAAEKLTSEHLHKKSIYVDNDVVVDLKKYMVYFPNRINNQQKEKLGDDGVIKEGSQVEQGDTLIAAIRKRQATTEEQKLRALSKSLVKDYSDFSVTWDQPYPGEVVRVSKSGRHIDVHVKTHEPMQVGDKLVGRHGNKGIVVRIYPDSEMPHDKEGKPIQVSLNPSGVPSRINLGQILETTYSKVADKTGKPAKIQNFSPEIEDYTSFVKKELKKHDLSDTEELFDPKTGKSMGQVLVGDQYIIKQKHQISKKLAARSYGSDAPYDMNRSPISGSGINVGGQAISGLDLYALLNHGARANLREMMTSKSDRNDEFWHAVQMGHPVPPPQPTFAYKKFISYLNGLGVNVERRGDQLSLIPFTDEQIKKMSSGEIKDALTFTRGLKPEKNGLFDPQITGGPGGGKWSHIALAEPMPNPMFEDAVAALVGANKEDIHRIVAGEQSLNGKKGTAAITDVLKGIDVNKEIENLESNISSLKGASLNKANKKLKYLRALKRNNLKPDVYILKNVPVVPPVFRPATVLQSGDLNESDLNGLYKGMMVTNMQLKTQPKDLGEEELNPLRDELYDGVKALMTEGAKDATGKDRKGILSLISGNTAKTGFFQGTMLKRRQDLSARATIIPEPEMGIDEVGVPKKIAREIYKPFVVRELVRNGFTPLKAREEIERRTPVAERALEVATENRPVLMKRDPVLHRHNILAFKPKLVEGSAIHIHPLVTGGYGADFDGDSMALYTPVSEEAVSEAREMFPSKNLFNPGGGGLMYKPGDEAQVGIYMLSRWGKEKRLAFSDFAQAAKAVKERRIEITDVVTIAGKKTTVGRVLLVNALPRQMVKDPKLLKILNRKEFRMDAAESKVILDAIAKTYPQELTSVVNKLKNLGNAQVYSSGFSYKLDDFAALNKVRDPILKAADQKAEKVKASTKSEAEKARDIIKIYAGATEQLDKEAKEFYKDEDTNSLWHMIASGGKGTWDQMRQQTIAPMLVMNSKDEVIPFPLTKSYSEGLNTAQYWSTMHGARKGNIFKSISSQAPGALTKMMVNTVLDNIITMKDCGTNKGIALDVDDPEIMDRFLAQPVTLKGQTIPKDTIVDPTVMTRLKNSGKITRVVVRSPLKCEAPEGTCAKCYGLDTDGKLPDIGTNVGIQSVHSVSEPAVNLAMKSFHTGGVLGSGIAKEVAKQGTAPDQADKFEHMRKVLTMPKKLKGSAVLSKADGTVSNIKSEVQGGWTVTVKSGSVEYTHYVPSDRKLIVKEGTFVQKGRPLTNGIVNPHDLLPLAGIGAVQSHLTEELHNVFKGKLKRRNAETIVRSMTNVTKIEDPGEGSDWVAGDVAPLSLVNAFNRSKDSKSAVKHTPIIKGVNVLPKTVREDWLTRLNYQNLESTTAEAVQQGWGSDLHGTSPIPGLVYGIEFGKGKEGRY